LDSTKLNAGRTERLERDGPDCKLPSTKFLVFTLNDIIKIRGCRVIVLVLALGVGENGVGAITTITARLALSIWIQPCIVPISQKYFDVGVQSKIFDVASDSIPLNETLVETFLNVSEISKVHPVNEEMETCWVGYWKEKDGMIG
jgi:hypothetical protein